MTRDETSGRKVEINCGAELAGLSETGQQRTGPRASYVA